MNAKTKEAAKTIDLRERMKAILESELEHLADLIGGLDGKERFDAILKLMPLVIPKAKPVHYREGEPDSWNWP